MPKRVTRSAAKTSLEASSSGGGGLVIKISKKPVTKRARGAAVELADVKVKGKKKGKPGTETKKVRPLTSEETALQAKFKLLASKKKAKGVTDLTATGEAETSRRSLLLSSKGSLAPPLRASIGNIEELGEEARSRLAKQLQAQRNDEEDMVVPRPTVQVAAEEDRDTSGAAMGRAAAKAAAQRQFKRSALTERSLRQSMEGKAESKDTNGEGEERREGEEKPVAGEHALPFANATQISPEYSRHTVFVGDISPNVMAHDLEDAFSTCGVVESVRVIPGKPFAFVQFVEAGDAQKALSQMNGASVCDCVIRVSPAKVQGSNAGPSASWTPSSRGFPGQARHWDPNYGATNFYPAKPPGPPPAVVPPQLRDHLQQQQIYSHLGPSDIDTERGLVSYDDI